LSRLDGRLHRQLTPMSAPAPLRLRPLEIGDVLDETFRLYRRHFLVLAGVSVAFAVPLAALAGYGFWSFFGSTLSQATNGNPIDVTQWGSLFVGLGLGYLVVIAIQPLQYGAITFAICESALGHPVTIGGMVRAAFRRYLHVLGYVLLIVAMVLLFCLFPLWIWILVGWVAVLPAMFIENLGLGAAMSRSWRLVQGRWWRTFLILFLVFILNYVVSLALEGFLYLGQALLSLVLSPYLALSIYEAAVIVVSALVNPILIIAIVLIYFDLRVRKEGIDLFQLAGRINPSPTAAA
jgi:hypothetical protein